MPRSGKTTLLNSLIGNYVSRVGFVTNEVREEGERVGFEIETYLGKKALLASVNFNTEHQVSKYFVDIENLDALFPSVSVLMTKSYYT